MFSLKWIKPVKGGGEEEEEEEEEEDGAHWRECEAVRRCVGCRRK